MRHPSLDPRNKSQECPTYGRNQDHDGKEQEEEEDGVGALRVELQEEKSNSGEGQYLAHISIEPVPYILLVLRLRVGRE